MTGAQVRPQTESLMLVRNAEELSLMGRALLELDGSASVLFSGGEGNQSQIDAGVEAYRGGAPRLGPGLVRAQRGRRP